MQAAFHFQGKKERKTYFKLKGVRNVISKTKCEEKTEKEGYYVR